MGFLGYFCFGIYKMEIHGDTEQTFCATSTLWLVCEKIKRFYKRVSRAFASLYLATISSYRYGWINAHGSSHSSQYLWSGSLRSLGLTFSPPSLLSILRISSILGIDGNSSAVKTSISSRHLVMKVWADICTATCFPERLWTLDRVLTLLPCAVIHFLHWSQDSNHKTKPNYWDTSQSLGRFVIF